MSKRAQNDVNRHINQNCAALQAEFQKSQKKDYNKRQKLLIRLADEELDNKNLLNEDVLALLAVMPAKKLKNASDELAITVLQTRGALAYMRGRDQQKNIAKPLTFEAAGLDPDKEFHRETLRDHLIKTAKKHWRLDEDRAHTDFDVPALAMPENETLQIGFWGRLGRAVAAPVFLKHDLKKLHAQTLPELPESIEAKPLPAVTDDLKTVLARYEREVEPLDLPALRRRRPPGHILPAPLQRPNGFR